MATENPPTVLKAECSNCGGERNCEVRGYHDQRGGNEIYDWQKKWYILECRGCEHVFAQTSSTNSEDYDHIEAPNGEYYAEYNVVNETWPAQLKRKRPDWISDAGLYVEGADALGSSLLELYGALDSDLNTLAAIGMRTSFDVAASLLKVDPNLSFQDKLKALVEGNHIRPVDRERLSTLVDAGSASVHRGWKPSADDLNTMMDVLEQFIKDAFVAPTLESLLDAKVAKMKDFVPGRPPRQKTGADGAPSPDSTATPSTELHITPELPRRAQENPVGEAK
ncbi:DUF4145 domain-containing protein [Mesorhizobium sp. M1163]|uniref:DUF4145 domain-containing protein n=1 Tax=Mesorhizobium sp. M1163 TaxID=2957065 RepID=UPI003339BC21